MTPFSPPLVPDSEEAREWLLEELGREVYSEAPSFWEWLLEQINRIIQRITEYGDGFDAVFLPLVVLALVAGVIILAFLYGGPVRRRRRVAPPPEDGIWESGDARTAEILRQSAARAAAAGDYSLAVIEQFRATARTLEEHGSIETTAGMTAGEVGHRIATAVPAAHGAAGPAAGRFNNARYGAIRASAADYEAMLDFDSAATTPRRVGP